VHHFDAAAGEGEGEGPDGAVAGPGYELVDGGTFVRRLCQSVVFGGCCRWLTAYTAYSATPIGRASETASEGDFAPSVGGLSMFFWRYGT
jgi:hypothetical protein